MKLIHLFYAKNDMSMYGLFLQVACYTLSCLYAKRAGLEIELHCNSKAYEYFKYIPYDNIIIDLDNIKDDLQIPDPFYAFTKFIVMKDQPLGTIHIDGDVFLINENFKELLNFDNYDVITQSIENPSNGYGYLWKESSKCFDNCEYPEWAKRACNSMYNCGVIGFNNQELKDYYFNTYWEMINKYKNIKNIQCDAVPDIIIEQQFLYDYCKYKNYSVKLLLDTEDIQGSAKRIKYSHLIGDYKRIHIDKVIKCIYKYNIKLYQKLKEIYYISFPKYFEK